MTNDEREMLGLVILSFWVILIFLKKSLTMQNFLFSQTFYPNQQIFLHGYIYIRHIRDILQLWSECVDQACASIVYWSSVYIYLTGASADKACATEPGEEPVCGRPKLQFHPLCEREPCPTGGEDSFNHFYVHLGHTHSSFVSYATQTVGILQFFFSSVSLSPFFQRVF